MDSLLKTLKTPPPSVVNCLEYAQWALETILGTKAPLNPLGFTLKEKSAESFTKGISVLGTALEPSANCFKGCIVLFRNLHIGVGISNYEVIHLTDNGILVSLASSKMRFYRWIGYNV